MLKIQAALPPELEQTVREVIGCCLNVHRGLGPGFLESVYSRALQIELDVVRLPFVRELEVPVLYRGRVINRHRLDIVVAGSVVLELKAVENLTAIHRAQLLSYLRASQMPVGLLVNFNEVILKDGLKRIIR